MRRLSTNENEFRPMETERGDENIADSVMDGQLHLP